MGITLNGLQRAVAETYLRGAVARLGVSYPQFCNTTVRELEQLIPLSMPFVIDTLAGGDEMDKHRVSDHTREAVLETCFFIKTHLLKES